jgi:energy-converting hydrogenase B subunit D
MIVMQLAILLLVALAGGAVVFTRVPDRQAVGVSFFGLMLAVMFFIFQAPDVALSEIVIGTVALPLMVLLAIAKIRVAEMEQRGNKEKEGRTGNQSADSHDGEHARQDEARQERSARQPEGSP